MEPRLVLGPLHAHVDDLADGVEPTLPRRLRDEAVDEADAAAPRPFPVRRCTVVEGHGVDVELLHVRHRGAYDEAALELAWAVGPLCKSPRRAAQLSHDAEGLMEACARVAAALVKNARKEHDPRVLATALEAQGDKAAVAEALAREELFASELRPQRHMFMNLLEHKRLSK